jgi:putative CocE/NonD family hydrolase
VLADSAKGVASTVAWEHDPDRLVPSLITSFWAPLLVQPDERDVEVRDDVLTFTGEARRAPLDLAGPVSAVLSLGSSAPSGHVMVKLVDVHPDGLALRILDGAAAFSDARPDAPITVELGHVGYRLRVGHRLRLEVASSCFPYYIWHPGTDEDPWEATRTARSEHRLRVDDGSSSITFWTLDGQEIAG